MRNWIIGIVVVIVLGLLIGSVVSMPGMDNENPLNDPDDSGPKGDIALGIEQVGVQAGSPELDQDPMAEDYTVTVDAENELTLNQYMSDVLGISEYNSGTLSVADTWSEGTSVNIRPYNSKVYWRTANISSVDSLSINFTAETIDGYRLENRRDEQAYIQSTDQDLSVDTDADNPHSIGVGTLFDVRMTSDGYTQDLELRDLDGAKLSIEFTVEATDEAGRTVTDDMTVNLSMNLEGTSLSVNIESIE